MTLLVVGTGACHGQQQAGPHGTPHAPGQKRLDDGPTTTLAATPFVSGTQATTDCPCPNLRAGSDPKS
ncbi:MAG TPA: hypothetical protein VGL49_08465, partial [Acidimicrobiales bacterium]